MIPNSPHDNDTLRLAWEALADVPDPEIPVLSVLDLGIVRDVKFEDDRLEIAITPTYSGCPAMDTIEQDVITHLAKVGLPPARVSRTLSPAWTTDWISEEGREKLRAYGIAPPEKTSHSKATLRGHVSIPQCPLCKSGDTEIISEFGSTPCKSHYRCRSCKEPFDYFKCL